MEQQTEYIYKCSVCGVETKHDHDGNGCIMSDDDRAALIEMERQLLGYCEMPQVKAILLRMVRILLKELVVN